MDRNINILILEDREADLVLTKRAILKRMPNVTITHAVNEQQFKEKLSWIAYDIVLADYQLPAYDGLAALLHVREHYPYLPFILVSGTLNSEEEAAASIVKGANGFVSKDNLVALPEKIVTTLDNQKKHRVESLRQEREKRERGIALQKAIHLLRKEEDFTAKEEVLLLLSKVNQNFSDAVADRATSTE